MLDSAAGTDFEAHTSSSVVLDGDITLVAKEVTIGVSSNVQVPANRQVHVYAEEHANFATSAIINNISRLPKNFRFYYAGTDNLGIGVGSGFYGFVYAPEATVRIATGGDFYGGIVGDEAEVAVGARYHYDRALEQAVGMIPGAPPAGPAVVKCWRQLTSAP